MEESSIYVTTRIREQGKEYLEKKNYSQRRASAKVAEAGIGLVCAGQFGWIRMSK